MESAFLGRGEQVAMDFPEIFLLMDLALKPLACPLVGGSPVLLFLSLHHCCYFCIYGENVSQLLIAQINFETISFTQLKPVEVVILFALEAAFFFSGL